MTSLFQHAVECAIARHTHLPDHHPDCALVGGWPGHGERKKMRVPHARRADDARSRGGSPQMQWLGPGRPCGARCARVMIDSTVHCKGEWSSFGVVRARRVDMWRVPMEESGENDADRRALARLLRGLCRNGTDLWAPLSGDSGLLSRLPGGFCVN
jgi:hypothetical protein